MKKDIRFTTVQSVKTRPFIGFKATDFHNKSLELLAKNQINDIIEHLHQIKCKGETFITIDGVEFQFWQINNQDEFSHIVNVATILEIDYYQFYLNLNQSEINLTK